MQLSPASLSTAKGQANSSGRAPTAAAALINHVWLQHPKHGLLFVSCQDTGRQFLVDGGSAVTLWPQSQPLRGARPVNVTLTSASGNTIPTFGSTRREINLGGQLFSHTFICAKVKHQIRGHDFLAQNRLVENYAGCFLTQIQTDLFIPATNWTRWADSVNHVQADSRVQQLLKEDPRVTQVSSSGYSKLQLQHGIYHHIDTGEVRARARPLFGKKRAAAECEFKAMLKGVVSRSARSPWAPRCTWSRSLGPTPAARASTTGT